MTSNIPFPSSLAICLLLIAAFSTLRHATNGYDSQVVHLYETLADFTARGQTTVELFAPLAAIVAPSRVGRMIISGATLTLWLLVGAGFMLAALVPLSRFWVALYILLASIAWIYSATDGHELVLSTVFVIQAFLEKSLDSNTNSS